MQQQQHGSVLLAAWRAEKSLSQAAVGEMVGVTQNTVSDWENRRKNPRIEHAAKLEQITSGDGEDGKPAVPMLSWMQGATAEPNGSAA